MHINITNKEFYITSSLSENKVSDTICNVAHLVFLIWFDFLPLTYKIFGPSGAQLTGHGLLIGIRKKHGPLLWTESIVLAIQKVSQTFRKAKLRPKNFCFGLIKNFCLGLIRPKGSFYKCLGYFLYW